MGRKAKGFAIAAGILIGLIGLVVLAGYVYDLHWQRKVEAKLADFRAAGQPVTWDEFLARRPKIPDEQNAALVLLKAFDQLPKSRDYEWALGKLWQKGQLGARHSEQLRGLMRAQLEADAPALALIRDAAKLSEGCFPRERIEAPSMPEFHWEDPFIRTIDVCMLDAEFRAATGDSDGAARRLADAHIVPSAIGDEPFLGESVVRLGADRHWAEGLECCLALCRLPADSLGALRQLIRREGRQLALAPAYYSWMAASHSLFCRPSALPFWHMRGGDTARARAGWAVYRMIPGVRQRDALFYYDVMDRYASAAKMPPREQLAQSREVTMEMEQVLHETPYTHIISCILVPDLGRGTVTEVKTKVQLDLARTALAVEEWRVEHGQWPDSLQQIVPDVLDAVPEDPFSDGPIRYAKTATGVVVYSVGQDGKDNGGIMEEEARRRAAPYESPSEGWDAPFRLLNPELRGAETLTLHDEVMGAGLKSWDLEQCGLTMQKLSELGLSEEDLSKPELIERPEEMMKRELERAREMAKRPKEKRQPEGGAPAP